MPFHLNRWRQSRYESRIPCEFVALCNVSCPFIQDWLTSIEMKFFESKVNLNWKNILKSIKEDPEGFIEQGGWSFLDAEQTDSEDEEAEMESDFEPRYVKFNLIWKCTFELIA